MRSDAVTVFNLLAVTTAIGLLAYDLMRVLVVDDNRDVAIALARLLRLDGHETFLAHDGVERVNATARYRPQVVLLDLGMPGLDGYDVCHRLRIAQVGSPLHIVAMTGGILEGDRERSLAAGFDEHLVKPVAYATLIALLGSLRPASPR